MNEKIENLEPKEVIKNFALLSKIPRGSGNEEEASLFLYNFAMDLGLEAYRDKEKNVYVKKPATKGSENKKTVLLQGHMDMVCEKESSSNHDFLKDPICLLTDGEFIFADKTTLGADDGIAVAIMMTLMESKDIPHPPLEFLITTGEEVGLNGAFATEADKLSADMMINIDTEEEGVLLTSCAGAETVRVTKSLSRKEAKEKGKFFSLEIDGLMGGHSGIDIHKERANATKLMARILTSALEKVSFNLSSISGGTKDNAITRDCRCVVFAREENAQAVKNAFQAEAEIIKSELLESDPNFEFKIQEEAGDFKISDEKTTKEIAELLYTLPSGVIKKSTVIDGFVIASLNMGIVRINGEELEIIFMVRSSIESLKGEIYRRIRVISDSFGAKAVSLGGYPGWQFDPKSELRDKMSEIYKATFGKELKIEAIHAGLECGIIKSKMPNLDIVAIGPDVFDCHTPREKMSVKSLQKVWLLIKNTLSELCK